MKAPFVWFGGKRRVADVVWTALGDVDNYVEPFAGSLAVLLNRTDDMGDGRRRSETVNDADGFLANFWRALAADPEAVAHHCDWPVNEVDLFARHLWLVNDGRSRLLNGMEADPEFYDAKIKVLSEQIEHHVKEEEEEMFPKVRKGKVDLVALGEEMEAFKAKLAPAAA